MRVLRSIWGYIWRGTIVDRLGDGMLVIAGVTVFIMMLVMAIYIISRKFEAPLPGAFHFSEQTMMILVAFPLAAVAVRKGHIQFELLIKRLSLKTQARMDLISNIVGILLYGAVTWSAWEVGFGSIEILEYRAGVIDFPVYPFRIALALGLSVFVLQLFVLLLRGVVNEVRRKPEAVSLEGAPPSEEITKGV